MLCKTHVNSLEALLDNILVPQSIVYMQQKRKSFKIEKDEIHAFIRISIMMSYNILPEIHDNSSKETDL